MFRKLFGSNKKVQTPRPPKPKSDQEKIDEKLLRAVGMYSGGTQEERRRQMIENSDKGDQFLGAEDFARLAGELQSNDVLVTSRALRERADILGIATERTHTSWYGDINPAAECIFCGSTGGVRVKIASVTEKYRMNSLAGAALGVGVNSQKNKIQRHCDKCSKTWHD